MGLMFIFALNTASSAESTSAATHDSPVQFSRDIKPIIDASCVKCHARGRSMGGLNMETRDALLKGGKSGPAIVPGDSKKSLVIELVSSEDPDRLMPRRGKKLSNQEINQLRSWIDQGALWDNSISFSKPPPRNLIPRRPEVPPGKPDHNPVDRFISQYLRRDDIGSVVSDSLYARRVFLDVIGLLPTENELNEFINDRRLDKRILLVDKLLNDNQRYAAHWLTFWNDHLQIGRAHV